jgi:hypothetical protein
MSYLDMLKNDWVNDVSTQLDTNDIIKSPVSIKKNIDNKLFEKKGKSDQPGLNLNIINLETSNDDGKYIMMYNDC